MKGKNFFLLLLAATGIFLALGECVACLVDPFGLWGTELRPGINNYKVTQGAFTDIFKPYEYRWFRPDTVYIGTSKVQIGWDPFLLPEEKGYNFAMPGMPLSNMRKYLAFSYRAHKPKRVYAGLDISLFDHDHYCQIGEQERKAFSQKRLDILSYGALPARMYALKESMSLMEHVIEAYRASNANPDAPPINLGGWHREHGIVQAVDQDGYYNVFNLVNRKTKEYKSFRYEPEAMECLRGIIDDAEQAGVELVLFFNPLGVDEHLLIYFAGIEPQWNQIKYEVAQMHPVYDFDCINPYNVDIAGNFYDFLHYRKVYGDVVHLALASGKTDGLAFLLDKDNAGEVLRQEQELQEEWRSENLKHFNDMRFYVETEQEAEKGVFKDFLGF